MNRHTRRNAHVARRAPTVGVIIGLIGGCAAMAGCTPDWYRRDADRQVQRLIEQQQRRAIDYTPDVDVPVDVSSTPTRKTYERLPTTALPDLLSDVVTTVRAKDGPGDRPRRRALGPPVATPPAPSGAPAAREQTAVARVRSRTRDPYRLGPDATIATSRRFALFESVAYAVENSREYRTEMERLYQSALNVTLERHLFTPRPFANVRTDYTGGQGDVDYRSAFTVTSEAGVRQQLPFGGEIAASALVQFVNAIGDQSNDGEDAALALDGSIPFLRSAGLVNLEPLIQSERSLVYDVRAFETFRRNFAIRVATAYFRLITQQQSIRNRYVRYLNTVELTNRTVALFDAGRISALEVQRAQQDLLQSEDNVNQTLVTYENALDSFKLLLGMPMDEELEVTAVQVDVPTPNVDVDVASTLARQYRLDLQTSRDRIDDAKRRVRNAENNLLPDLDLTFGTRGGSGTESRARDVNADSITYDAGLRLDLPLDRVAERNGYRRALIQLEAAKRDVLQLEDDVLSQIRSSVRTIRAAIASLDLQRQGIAIAEARLEFANESLITGRTQDSRNVLEGQTSLLSAQDQYEAARANLQVAILSYLRDTGVLRLDPASGELGLAMERTGGGSATTRRVNQG